MFNKIRSESLTPVWIFCLGMLAVGVRNFEQGGIGVDGPLYALMARGAVRTGEWFALNGTDARFMPFADHPHLGIWLIALVFKLLPAADWSARLVGIGFYFGFVAVFFRFVKQTAGPQAAVAAVLALWSMDRFSHFFANVYLDPGALFFGASALFLAYHGGKSGNARWAALGGVCLALSTLVKGLTVLGFGPALVWVAWLSGRERKADLKWCQAVGSFVLSAALVMGLYLLAVRVAVPGLISQYWHNQWSNRFSLTWDWSRLWGSRYWWPLLRESHFLLGVAVLGALWRRPRGVHWVPWICIASFTLMYAPADRLRDQYWVVLFPWIAWAVGWSFFGRARWPVAPVQAATAVVAMSGVLLLHLIPYTVHVPLEPAVAHVQKRVAQKRVQQVVLDLRPWHHDFTYVDRYTWYADVPVQTVTRRQAVPAPQAHTAYVLYRSSPERIQSVLAAGWCLDEPLGRQTVFLDCPRFSPPQAAAKAQGR